MSKQRNVMFLRRLGWWPEFSLTCALVQNNMLLLPAAPRVRIHFDFYSMDKEKPEEQRESSKFAWSPTNKW